MYAAAAFAISKKAEESLASAEVFAQIALDAALENGDVVSRTEHERVLEEAHLARIEAQNPNIDIERVREERRKRRDQAAELQELLNNTAEQHDETLKELSGLLEIVRHCVEDGVFHPDLEDALARFDYEAKKKRR